MADEPESFILSKFRKTVEELLTSVREMIAASRLLRARVESADELQRTMNDRITGLLNRMETIDQRLTKLENEQGQYRSVIP